MKLEELKKQLEEKELFKTKLEITFHQTNGQIALLRDMIHKEESIAKEQKNDEQQIEVGEEKKS